MAKNKKTPKATAKIVPVDGLPHGQRSPPSSPTHRLPDLFELSEYDFEELCEELVRDLEGVRRAAPKNRRGNPQFGVDAEGFSVRQKPFAVLSELRGPRDRVRPLGRPRDHQAVAVTS